MKLGNYIVLEGVIGSGKSTQARKLREYLHKKYPHKEIILTREPGGTEIAETIRTLVQATKFQHEDMHPLTDVYLYASARAQLLKSLIEPALKRDAIVISDRSFCSSLAIQGEAQGMGIERVRQINKEIVQNVTPDAILFLDIDAEKGIQRTFDPYGDKFEQKGLLFSQKVYLGYQKLFSFHATKEYMHRINAEGNQEQVFSRIQNTIKRICAP